MTKKICNPDDLVARINLKFAPARKLTNIDRYHITLCRVCNVSTGIPKIWYLQYGHQVPGLAPRRCNKGSQSLMEIQNA